MSITSAKEVEFYDTSDEAITYPEGASPAEIYIGGDLETRSDVILNHPDVIGFIFLYEDVVTKAFLPTKVVNFQARNENKKVFAAVSGSLTNYTPFSVPDRTLLSDVYYISNLDKFTKIVSSINVAKNFKDYKGDLATHFTNESKSKKVSMVSFPIVLPLVKGMTLQEGHIEDDDVYNSLGLCGELYADWAYLNARKFIASKEMVKSFPTPTNAIESHIIAEGIPIKVLFQSKHIKNSPYCLLKNKVEKLINAQVDLLSRAVPSRRKCLR